MTILIIAEHDHQTLSPATACSLTAAQQIGGDIHILVAGMNSVHIAQAATQISGVSKVLHADGAALKDLLAENIAKQVLAVSAGYSHILFPASTWGKSIAPRVAAILDVAQISEITHVVNADTFERFIYAGNALATVQSHDSVKVLTVRASSFAAASLVGGGASTETVAAINDDGKSVLVRRDMLQSARPELASARIIVAGGKGLQNKENFEHLLFPLADKLNAAIGATRSAIDVNCAPNDWQLGQTGRVVAPELYIAIGISGAIQHTSGVKDSKVFVAINKDPDAPIFKYADYGLVGDLFTLLPELTKAL
ncbi:MAG: electron transfer flavoprotein subunit alpha/FixB family protein [Saezia sp.]